MRNEVFLDTSFAIALASERDHYHQEALQLAAELQRSPTRLLTTRAIQLEIGNALSRQRFRPASIQLLTSLEADPNVEIVSLSEDLYRQAFRLYRQRQDKEWGLVDCLSFVVMVERDVKAALTSDVHFQQTGFQVLLKKAGA